MIIYAKSAVISGALRENIWLEVEYGHIISINYGKPPRVDNEVDGILIPGFVDIHCHGGGGFYFSDLNSLGIEQAINTHLSRGTTTLFASLVTAPLDVMKAQIRRLVPFVEEKRLGGIHLEGPYLAPTRCGAHDPKLLREPKVEELSELLDVGQGHIKMVTIAPEVKGAIESIRYLVESSVTVAIGHSDADFNVALQGVEAGARVVTHFPNAVSKLDDEGHTLADLAMSESRLTLEMIMDGHHVNDEIARRIYNANSERIALVTDAMCAAGSNDGHYLIGQLPVTVKNSIARLDSNGALAGSTLTMDVAFFNAQSRMGTTIEQAVAVTSTIPARTLGLHEHGEIAVGMKADLLEVNLVTKQVRVIL